MKLLLSLTWIALLLGVLPRAFGAELINGAGATFPEPLYSKWFSEFQKVEKEIRINYQPIGSGGGIQQFLRDTVDFGATDAPMTNEELAKASRPVLHLPTVLGAVVVTYNLPGVSAKLQLTGELIAEIYLGKITDWSDAKVKALNPKLNLPKQPILVVRRSDGSGTTGIFTDYLAKVSAPWKNSVGAGKAVSWPVGLGGKGNEGVASLVKQTPGAIGYVELVYAKTSGLPYAAIQNKAGKFVEASIQGVTAAAAGSLKMMPADFRVSITNAEGAGSYPISGFTYLLVYQTMKGEKGKGLVKFLRWALRDGQTYAEPMAYAPLPGSLAKKVIAKVDGITIQ
ncbi:MAG: phosphate ABC transporter substrate-binding protein PstS [Bdellovibrionota bacterium]